LTAGKVLAGLTKREMEKTGRKMKTTSGEPFDKKSIFHSLTPLLPMGHSEFMHEF